MNLAIQFLIVKKLLLSAFIFLSAQAHAQEFCTSDNLRQQKVGGFCIVTDGPELVAEDMASLKQTVTSMEARFPRLFKKVYEKGYRQIQIQSAQQGETGGAVLAQVVPERKLVVLYTDFFSVFRHHPELQNLGYSVAEIAFIHELLHVYDDDAELVRWNLGLIGWGVKSESPRGFQLPELPQLANIWINTDDVARIKQDVTPVLQAKGAWAAYTQARTFAKKYGYPTVYSIVGGPLESFAELGAYIALDPAADSYIRPGTIRWFRQNIFAPTDAH